MRLSPGLASVSICLGLALGAGAEEPPWLKEARAREGKLGRAQRIESSDGLLRAKPPAKLATPISVEEGAYTVNLDVGAQGPVECVIQPDGFDPAALLRESARLTFELLEPMQGKIEARAVERVDAGAIGASPYLALDWIYRANPGSGPQLGGLKQIAAIKHGVGIYCGHAEIGYGATFRKAVHALVESLEYGQPPAKPDYTEIAVFSLNGMRVGVATSTLVRDAEGDRKSEQRTAMLVPAGPDALRASDTFHVHWMRPDATLINALYVDGQNGEIESNLSLKPGEDGSWTVDGTFKGKPIQAEWPASEAPATWLTDVLAVRARLAQPNPTGAVVSTFQWLPEAVPTKRSEAKTTLGKPIDGERFSARQTAAGIEMDAILERRTGLPVSGTIAVGPTAMVMERVFIEGGF